MLWSFASLAAAGLALGLAWTGSAAPPAGPEAVIALHEQLFAALDKGDEGAIAEFLSARLGTPFFLANAEGAGQRCENSAAAAQALSSIARASRRSGSAFQTRITSAKADCHSPELSYAVLEFERSRVQGETVEVKRYRSTSLAQYVDKRWRIAHWHVSAVP